MSVSLLEGSQRGCTILGGNFDLNNFSHVFFLTIFLKEMVFLLDVHCSVMLFFAGDMCSGTMRMEFKTQHENIPSCATQQNIRHRSINTSDKSYFHHSLSTCHDIVRGMMPWINVDKQKQSSINTICILEIQS